MLPCAASSACSRVSATVLGRLLLSQQAQSATASFRPSYKPKAPGPSCQGLKPELKLARRGAESALCIACKSLAWQDLSENIGKGQEALGRLQSLAGCDSSHTRRSACKHEVERSLSHGAGQHASRPYTAVHTRPRKEDVAKKTDGAGATMAGALWSLISASSLPRILFRADSCLLTFEGGQQNRVQQFLQGWCYHTFLAFWL